MKSEQNPTKTMSEQELKLNLITCDYRGKEFKEKVLQELLDRSFQQGYQEGINNRV